MSAAAAPSTPSLPTTTPVTHARTPREALRSKRFWLHYGEMVLVMVVGMMLLAPLIPEVASWEVEVLLMATTMAVPMALWMLVRGHRTRPTLEMAAVMYAPFVLLLPLVWAGWMSVDLLSALGHTLMFVGMLAVMALRPAEYTCHRGAWRWSRAAVHGS
jgi:hypothetical protein